MAVRTVKPETTKKVVVRKPRIKSVAIENISPVPATKSGVSLTTILLTIVILLLIGIAFFVGALWQKLNNLQTTQVVQNTTANQVPVAQPQLTLDQVKNTFSQSVIKFGDATRKIVIIEFADPSCPYCHAAAGLDPELNNQLGPNFKLSTSGGTYIAPLSEFRKLVDSGTASYAYIYFPGHGNGEMGMKALYCANDQGKFWEAHDKLMTNAGYKLMNDQVKNDTTKVNTVVSFLSKVVDASQLKACLNSGNYDSRLNTDTSLAQSFKVDGTPTFFVNTNSYPGAFNYTSIKPTIDTLLK